jgi:hypothetical protein
MFPYFVAVVLAAPAPPATETIVKQPTLPAACDHYANSVAEAVGNASVAIGRVAAPFELATGAGVEMELTAALERIRKGFVAPKANIEIRGEIVYQSVPAVTMPSENDDGSQKLPVIKLRTIDTRDGKELAARAYGVTHLTEIARLLGVTAKVEADSTPAEKYRAFEKAQASPTAYINKTLVKPIRNSPCSVELFVRNDGKLQARNIEHKGGLVFVTFAQGDKFTVKLSNPTDGDIGARLFYDGVDGYHFAEQGPDGQPFARIYHVPPKNGLMMMGWTLTRRTWEEFRIGQPEAVALPPTRDSKWGSVTVAISTMRPNPNQPGRLLTDAATEFVTIRLAR